MLLTNMIDHTKEHYGEYPFLYHDDKVFTNHDVEKFAKKISILLRNQGIADGDKVIVSMPNNPEVIFSFQGILRSRNIVIPVMYLLHPNEIFYILHDSNAKAIFTTAEFLPKMIEAAKNLTIPMKFIVTDSIEDRSACEGYDIIELYPEIEKIDVSEEVLKAANDNDLAVILYTSGTTGRPKGVMLTHKNLSVEPMQSFQTSLKEGRNERNTTIVVLPLAHIYGFGVMCTSFMLGNSIVVYSKFDLEKVCQAIENFKVKWFAVVPAMVHSMAFSPIPDKYDLSSLESVNCGSANLPLMVIETFEKRFNADIREAYGLSEAATGGVAGHWDGVPIKRGSAGIPFPYVEVRIVDQDGTELPRGEVGEIIVKGDTISPGYYGLPEETAKAIKNGWLYTGDLAMMDDEDYIFIVDRKKDLIIRGGFNIYPRDLEEIIIKHEAVSDVAVIGVADERMGEEVVACVVKKPGSEVSEQDIISYTQKNIAKYKSPRRVIFVESLPRNGVGKILKRKLRDDFEKIDVSVS
ncbi:class I adenylate-forming enzyme family protein [Neobacillus niacini]|uniref:class I adenylate-forming enzyme family protein n=1 Tax=Neobacillus niacini TaxID=86668 RepID=UPI003982FADD